MNTMSLTSTIATARWVKVGRSVNSDPVAAATEALAGCLTMDVKPSLVVVFADHRYELDCLAETIFIGAGRCEMIGCTTAGEIASDGSGPSGVVIAAFGGDGFSVATVAAEEASSGMRDAGRVAASAVAALSHPRENTILLTFTDTFAGDQQEVLRGIYHELGAAVPVVGGCAGDDLEMKRTYQFHNGRVLTDAVVAAALSSDGEFGIGVSHGWTTVGEPMTVTANEGTVLLELDSRPALDVYLERNQLTRAITEDAAEFTRFAMRHPLALARHAGEPLVRFLTGACPKSGGLKALAAIPEGANVWLMTGDEQTVLGATHAACDEAFAAISTPPQGVLVFDCVTRRDMLGTVGVQREVDVIAESAGAAPIAGFFTYGEIARTHGINGFHHETLVVLAVG